MTCATRAAALALVLAAAVLAVAWATRVAEGRRALGDADAALARGDAIQAILAARSAAEARCPGCAAPEAGFAKLETIAKDAELRSDDATAFAAWRAARAAVLATAPESPRRARVDAETARFGHRLEVAARVAGAAPVPAAAEDWLRATLATSGVPDAASFAVIGAGASLFLWGALRFVFAKASRRIEALLAAAGAALAAAGALLF